MTIPITCHDGYQRCALPPILRKQADRRLANHLQHPVYQLVDPRSRFADRAGEHVGRGSHQLVRLVDDDIFDRAFDMQGAHLLQRGGRFMIAADGALHALAEDLRRQCRGNAHQPDRFSGLGERLGGVQHIALYAAQRAADGEIG